MEDILSNVLNIKEKINKRKTEQQLNFTGQNVEESIMALQCGLSESPSCRLFLCFHAPNT